MLGFYLGLAWLGAFSTAQIQEYGNRRDYYRFLGCAYILVHGMIGVNLWTAAAGLLILPTFLYSFSMAGRRSML
jgi:hypothetical protein